VYHHQATLSDGVDVTNSHAAPVNHY